MSKSIFHRNVGRHAFSKKITHGSLWIACLGRLVEFLNYNFSLLRAERLKFHSAQQWHESQQWVNLLKRPPTPTCICMSRYKYNVFSFWGTKPLDVILSGLQLDFFFYPHVCQLHSGTNISTVLQCHILHYLTWLPSYAVWGHFPTTCSSICWSVSLLVCLQARSLLCSPKPDRCMTILWPRFLAKLDHI